MESVQIPMLLAEVDRFAQWALQNGPICLYEVETRLPPEEVRLGAGVWRENISLLAPGKYFRSQHQAGPGGGDISPQVSKGWSSPASLLTFLCRAVRKNHLYAVETMIAAGAEVDIQNIQGGNSLIVKDQDIWFSKANVDWLFSVFGNKNQ